VISSLLTPPQVLKLWPLLEPHIESALHHSIGEYDPFSICLMALSEQAHIWLTRDEDGQVITVIVTRFTSSAHSKSLLIMTCAGQVPDWDTWTAHHKTLEEFAKKNGCNSMQVWGRRGWERRLRHLESNKGKPYQLLYHVYNMEI
jgi:hypothetical protein